LELARGQSSQSLLNDLGFVGDQVIVTETYKVGNDSRLFDVGLLV
jgi:hypothetical protein